MKTKLLIALFFVSSIAFCQGGKGLLMAQEYPELTGWEANSMITNGLTDILYYAKAEVFRRDHNLYMIAYGTPSLGDDNKYYYQWDEITEQWETASSYEAEGLPGDREHVSPTTFGLDGILYTIIGDENGGLDSYIWSRTYDQWMSSTADDILDGLTTPGSWAAPSVFKFKGYHYLIMGYKNGTTNMFQWNVLTEQWSDFGASTGDLGDYVRPYGFINNDKCYLIIGEQDGVYGYRFDGGVLYQDVNVVSGISTSGGYNHFAPCVFRLNGVLYLIMGRGDGTFTGYKQITD